jgi:hypothetical protein
MKTLKSADVRTVGDLVEWSERPEYLYCDASAHSHARTLPQYSLNIYLSYPTARLLSPRMKCATLSLARA